MLCYRFIDNKKNNSIVLLHGYGGSSNCFKKQIELLSIYFNIVSIDMHGHGISSNIHLALDENLSLKRIVEDIDEVLSYLHISSAHFLGLSLGTIVANVYAYYYPHKVLSIVNVGAVIKFNFFFKALLSLIFKLKQYLPHQLFYSIAGYSIMPYKSHRQSRHLFIKEAKKMNRIDFCAWGTLLITYQDKYKDIHLPNDLSTLYISGEYDYFFIRDVKKFCSESQIKLHIIANAGHICNIDNVSEFNNMINDYYFKIINKND